MTNKKYSVVYTSSFSLYLVVMMNPSRNKWTWGQKEVLKKTSFRHVLDMWNVLNKILWKINWFSPKSNNQLDNTLNQIIKILEKKKFWEICIKNVPNEIDKIEDTNVFKTLLRLYIRKEKKNQKIKWKNYFFEGKDITSNIEMFKWFEEFCLSQSMFWNLSINNYDPLNRAKIESLFDDFKVRYSYHVRMSTKYYDEIIKKLWLNKHDESTKKAMLKFNTAYHMMKQVFSWKERKGKDEYGNSERFFEHLKWTMEIIIRELPNPSINKIIMALLHDFVEDIPWVTFEMLEHVFSKEIADGVKELTKKDWKNFIWEENKQWLENFEKWKSEKELNKFEKARISDLSNFENYSDFELEEITKYKHLRINSKKLRNKKYFLNLEQFSTDALYVKFADRIHNLRTIKWMSNTHIAKKIVETERYFLKPTLSEKLSTNGLCKAFDIIKKEIDDLKKDRDVYLYYIYLIGKDKEKID